MDNYYKHHVFVCCNQREAPADCCANHRSSELAAYAKDRAKTLGLARGGRIRINRAGCLGRCDDGPILVIYPEGTWYHFDREADIDEILTEHLQHGRIVERLKR
ncbi:MAG: 2Fe-2S ferredoxin [Candidatus Dactylopiibacterium carminicum]|uniref:2Fe-2S ferredoxin n=1 Tax=Candidatus Dactylopiibacterium carminicum TaxID=857335 RepID=A0A272EYM2_9RHOO|nr:(2Fe-2S) ferredoxin domain-containing protein [Candidatus Dactylopiibacterium carminicum]KAF7600579.1 2Fe-2S ferredoxin [Candidatus Dactylopiibacterium carminicum]PAS94218.1 MAG: 2Fe-2S ferredoxin [Candidatus Dactylopiibacterium carminicum]PAS95185.1 MAG: 2Fe-2S ferredoxin [Candidatus Dactylopiibacterium carminicum]PAT00584.1 MAG: 2Fe-2S ferredoxin [Candidatus Dactylopiibacterium carminicum]